MLLMLSISRVNTEPIPCPDGSEIVCGKSFLFGLHDLSSPRLHSFLYTCVCWCVDVSQYQISCMRSHCFLCVALLWSVLLAVSLTITFAFLYPYMFPSMRPFFSLTWSLDTGIIMCCLLVIHFMSWLCGHFIALYSVYLACD